MVEEEKAVGISYWELGVGGWVGGWVDVALSKEVLGLRQDVFDVGDDLGEVGRWVGGWLGAEVV